ncbi:MAG TPA: FAD-dependent oxidoreductase, partial [Rhizomicrobium sp.]
RAQLALARTHGAEIRTHETVLSFESRDDGVTIMTDQGRYRADRLIIAAGAWLPQLVPEYAGLFKIYRQTQFWFEVENARAFAPDRFPVFIWELQNSKQGLYGFPAVDGESAIKMASEQFDSTTTPQGANRNISEEEIDGMRALLMPHLAGVTTRCARATTCLYTVTPDFGFVIDTHPEADRVLIASPCSGHGFKHSAAIGEALADLVLGHTPRFDLEPFRLDHLIPSTSP